jgi:hypothetical protein
LYVEATYDRLLSFSCKDEFSQLRPDTVLRSIPAPHLLLQREPQKAATVIMAFIGSLQSSPDALIVQVNYGRRAHTATAPPKSRQPELSILENRVSRLPIKRVLQKVRQNTNPDEVTFSIRRWAVESPIGLHGYVHPDL